MAKTNPKNNTELANILHARKDLFEEDGMVKRVKFVRDLTGYGQSTVSAWLAPRTKTVDKERIPNPAFRPMPCSVLRYLKLELGMTQPKFPLKASM